MRNLLWAVLLSFCMLSPVAFAEDRAKAEVAFKEGIQAYKERRYQDAADAYQRACEMAPSAVGPYRELGKAYEALGKKEEAAQAYQEYLTRAPEAEDAEQIKARLKVLGVAAIPPVSGSPSQETKAAQPAALSVQDPTMPNDAPTKKRPTWLYVAGGAALVGVGVGTAIVIDVVESGGGDGGGKGRGRGGDNDSDKAKRGPLMFTFSF